LRRTTRLTCKLAASVLLIGALAAAMPPPSGVALRGIRLTDSYDQQIDQLQQQYDSLGTKLQGLQGSEAAADAQAAAVLKKFKAARHHKIARCVTIDPKPLPKRPGAVAVVCAGTSDLPVAEEAAVTADIMGNRVERVYDVGVAGLHRLLGKLELIRQAHAVIVVAGMEGALPSVAAGLISRPIIAVPTSVGYGANFGGLTPLLGMLNSCSSGVTVVNIDNGFGAAYAASQINALCAEAKST